MFRYSVILVCFGLALVLVAAEEETCEVGGKTYKVGESFPSEQGCGLATCDGAGRISGKGCGQFALAPGSKCRLERGEGKYPDCCDRPVCPGDPRY